MFAEKIQGEEKGLKWCTVQRGRGKGKRFQKTYVRTMTGFSGCPLQIWTGALVALPSGKSKTLEKCYSILEPISLSLAQSLENV